MRLTDLFGARVVDRDGVVIGHVHDVRITRENVGDVGERLSIAGVLVGLGSVGVRLGYASGSTRGPWGLRKLFTHVARHAKYVPWERIAIRGPRELRLSVSVDDLDNVETRR
jgi:hypothetical protein